MCPSTKPRSCGTFLALCGLWFVMTPHHSSLSLVLQMHHLPASQQWIPLTHHTVSLPMKSLLSCLLLSCYILTFRASAVALHQGTLIGFMSFFVQPLHPFL